MANFTDLEKHDYYSKRMDNPKLTPGQRAFAKKRVCEIERNSKSGWDLEMERLKTASRPDFMTEEKWEEYKSFIKYGQLRCRNKWKEKFKEFIDH